MAGALLVLVILVTGSGCSAPAPDALASTGPFELILESGIEEGADDTQLEILRAANAAGEVTFEQLRAAVDSTFSCFDNAGIAYSSNVAEGAIPNLTYSFASPDGDSQIADSCIRLHSMYVEWAYQTQPAAQELVDAAFEAKRDEIVTCLQGLGLAVAADASVDEIKAAASYTVEEWENTWKDAPVSPDDCVANAGILNW